MSAQGDQKSCPTCSLPSHASPTPNLAKIIEAMSKLTIDKQTLIVATKKLPTYLSADKNVSITRIEEKKWSVSIENTDQMLVSFSFAGFDEPAQIPMSTTIDIIDPTCISTYISENCICGAQIRVV